MAIVPQIEHALLKIHTNPFENEQCNCGSDLKRLVHCRDCFQYPTACARCFVARHRHTPFHWAQVWDTSTRIYTKTDYTAVLPESEGISIQLGHPGDSLSCTFNSQPLLFTVVDTNGMHNTRIRFCHCTEPYDRATQLLDAELFPASTDQPETAFTFAHLERFQMHNLQTKVNAFDWNLSLRRLTNDVSTHKVSVRFLILNAFIFLMMILEPL